jgi:hypothetical protein
MKAKSQNKLLNVDWQLCNACNGYFLDCFESCCGMFFLKNICGNFDYHGCFALPEYNNHEMYKYLNPLPHIRIQINNNIKLLENNYIAVHIRRTDHAPLAKLHGLYTDDNEFIKFIDNYPDMNIYIATDNKETQDFFYNKYKQRIKAIQQISTLSNGFRKTSMEHAVVDIFTCANAKYFLGSGWSSFSELITDLRKLRNV